MALLSAYDIEQVAMAVIALLGRTGGGVAIDAAGMREHRIHLLPGSKAFGARRCDGCESPFDRGEQG